MAKRPRAPMQPPANLQPVEWSEIPAPCVAAPAAPALALLKKAGLLAEKKTEAAIPDLPPLLKKVEELGNRIMAKVEASAGQSLDKNLVFTFSKMVAVLQTVGRLMLPESDEDVAELTQILGSRRDELLHEVVNNQENLRQRFAEGTTTGF